MKKLRKELSTKKDWVLKTKNERTATYNREKILKEATKFFEELYTSKASNKTELDISHNEDVPEFLKDEIIQTIIELKNNKSPGSDGITNELIKYGEEELAETIQSLFNNILRTEEIPSQWTLSPEP